MTEPAATAIPPPKPEKHPDDKKIVLSKSNGGKWELKLSGPVKQRDINHLRRYLQISYDRAKRKARLEAQAKSRKELTNATARP